MNKEGLETPSAYLGTLMVNQGPDFTLTPAPAGDSFHYLLVPQGQTINVTLSSIGLNGFSGTIGLGYGGNGCFTVGVPQTMAANSQVVVPVTNSYCGSNQGTVLYFSGTGMAMQRAAAPVYLLSTASADFSVGVSPPTGTATVLSYQSPISYPITVSSVNGGSGTVSLALDNSSTALPTDVNCTVSPSSVALTSYGSASGYLNCTATQNTPGGSFPVGIITSLGSNWHTASVTLTAQTITFTTSSPPPVKNNGNSVQITLTASSPLPSLTTCSIYTKPGSPSDPTTCTVQNGSNNTAIVTVTAPRQTVHGVRLIQFNGGAFTTQANIYDAAYGTSGGGLSGLVAGSTETIDIPLPDIDFPCEIEGYCPSIWVSVDTPGWAYVSALDLDDLQVTLSPPLATSEGWYDIYGDVCASYFSDEEPDAQCEPLSASVYVTAAAPPPTITQWLPQQVQIGVDNYLLTIEGTNFGSNGPPSLTFGNSGITYTITSYNEQSVSGYFNVPVTAAPGTYTVTLTPFDSTQFASTTMKLIAGAGTITGVYPQTSVAVPQRVAIYWLGPATSNDNCVAGSSDSSQSCYWNWVVLQVAAGAGGSPPSTVSPATWSFSDTNTNSTPSYIDTLCLDQACSQVAVHAVSQPPQCGNVNIRAVVNGIDSQAFTLLVDWPASAGLLSIPIPDRGLAGGYYSTQQLRLVSACGQPMPYIDVHEEFPGPWKSCVGNVTGWLTGISQNNWGQWRTLGDGSFVDYIAVPDTGDSPPVQTPQTPLSGEAVSWAQQFIFVGSQDIVNLGKYFTAAPNSQVRYIDHGRDESGTWRCPGQ